MAKQVQRVVSSRRGKRKNISGASTTTTAPLFPTPPPPFLSLCRGYVYEPEPVTLDVSLTVPLQQLHNRAAVHDTVLRSTLHRLHAAPSLNSSTSADLTTPEATTTPTTTVTIHRTLVHVESITIHTDSARQINHKGDVRLRATVKAVLARVEHGLFAGIVESSVYTDTMMVRVRSEVPTGAPHTRSTIPTSNMHTQQTHGQADEGKDGTSLLITARCLEEEPVVVGQAVLLVSEPGTLRCLSIRPPRLAPGLFNLRIENGVAEIRVDWPAKGKRPRDEEERAAPMARTRSARATRRTATTAEIEMKTNITANKEEGDGAGAEVMV